MTTTTVRIHGNGATVRFAQQWARIMLMATNPKVQDADVFLAKGQHPFVRLEFHAGGVLECQVDTKGKVTEL